MDQQANPWITKVKGKSQHQISLIKNGIKTPCKTSTENNAVPQGKLCCSLNRRDGLMPRYKYEAQTVDTLFQEVRRGSNTS